MHSTTTTANLRLAAALLLLLPLLLQAVTSLDILISNDDGWAEANIRALSKHLRTKGHRTIIAAPAENESGTGSREARPVLRKEPCQYNSCPANGPSMGTNKSDPTLNYINSFPVTSVQFGLEKVAPRLWDGPPDLVVTGINVGNNMGNVILESGTVNAAAEAARQGIPAIAFSGDSGEHMPWTRTDLPHYVHVYAELASRVVDVLVRDGPPFLPDGLFLNVNLASSTRDQCESADDFSFIFSRIAHSQSRVQDDAMVDMHCSDGQLPRETEVLDPRGGCRVSISLADGFEMDDADQHDMYSVYQYLWFDSPRPFMSCLPHSPRP